MSDAELDELRAIVTAVAERELLPRFTAMARAQKQDGSVLTEADLAAQTALKHALAQRWPQYAFLGEEMDESARRQRVVERWAPHGGAPRGRAQTDGGARRLQTARRPARAAPRAGAAVQFAAQLRLGRARLVLDRRRPRRCLSARQAEDLGLRSGESAADGGRWPRVDVGGRVRVSRGHRAALGGRRVGCGSAR